MEFLHWIIFVLVLAILCILFFFYFQKKKKGYILKSLEMTLFLVMLPKYELKKKETAPQEEKALIAQMEQIYTNFLYLKRPKFFQRLIYGDPRIVLEIASQTGEADISFYVAVPKFLETAFEKYVQGVYPKAVVEKIPQDYTIFEPGGTTTGSYLKLERTSYLPINTYKNLEKDPLAATTNALSKIAPDEGAVIQIIIKPFSQKKWRARGAKILAEIKDGQSVEAAVAKVSRPLVFEILADIVNLIIGQTKQDKAKKNDFEFKKSEVNAEIIQAVQEKIQKQAFEANIRLIASAQNKERANEILEHLESAFAQFSLSALNSFKPIKIKGRNLKKMVYNFSFRNFSSVQKSILNIEELTSIYHFPVGYTETPHIKTIKSGVAAPPLKASQKGLNLIGEVFFRGEKKEIYFVSRQDRRRHFYIVGQTGTGKSSLLSEMIRQDIEAGEGVGVVDPHGELIESALANIPKKRIEDVVLFEPFNTERPMGLNMLESDTPGQEDFAVQEMIAIFYKLFPPEIIGPMFEHYMRNAMLALMADKSNPGTLVEIPRIFTDSEFMENVLKKVANPMVRSFWLKEWQQITGNTKSDMLGYVISKVGRFVENEMMRNIIGQSHSGFDLGQIMDEKKIFLANLSKGLTGEVNSTLLGLILVSKIQMAAMRRAGISEEQRQDFYLYIDEFQSFTTDSIASILSEARKYRLNLILAHQYMPQLTPEIRNAVIGNVGTMAAFRIGADDAEFLEKQFEPEFSRFDLMNLDNFNLIIKLMIEGEIFSPFKLKTIMPKKENPELIKSIKKISELKYGRVKALVEQEISERSKLMNI